MIGMISERELLKITYILILNFYVFVLFCYSLNHKREEEVIFNGRRLHPFLPVTILIIWLYSINFQVGSEEVPVKFFFEFFFLFIAMLLTGWKQIYNPNMTEYCFFLEIIYTYIYVCVCMCVSVCVCVCVCVVVQLSFI